MRLVDKLLRAPLFASLLVSLLAFFAIVLIRGSGSLESLELTAYDWFVRMRPNDYGPDQRIVFIAITEKDILNQGEWPLTDESLTNILKILLRYRPRAIGVDIYRDIPEPPGNDELNEVLTSNKNIIMIMKLDAEGVVGIPPPPALKNSDRTGFVDMIVDPGGIVRRGLLFLDDGINVYYSFALRLALHYLQEEGIHPQPDDSNPGYIRLGETTIRPFESNDGGYVGADSQGYQFLLDYRVGQKEIHTYSLESLFTEKIDAKTIKGKIVLIGVKAESVKDFFFTPFSRGHSADQQITGTVLHGLVVSQLLRFGLEAHPAVITWSDRSEWLWIFLWTLLGGAAGLKVRSPWRFSLLASGGLFVIGLTAYFAFLKGWWIPLVPPATAWLASAALVTAYMSNKEKKQRAFLMHLFSRHVSNEVAESVWQERDQFLDGGRPRPQKLTATVLFTDIVGFTSVSENLDPKSLMDWLNEYMEAMGQQVIEHGGIINKYIGDAIMAIFGVPVARKTESEKGQDATNAVHCALAMEKKLTKLNTIWQTQGLPIIGMRIGIFTGPLVAGSLGSAQRLEYTVIGDTVNTASRLESFDKNGFDPDLTGNPCRIFIGEATLHYLDDRFETERVGEVRLKGKDQRITVHRVLGEGEKNLYKYHAKGKEQ